MSLIKITFDPIINYNNPIIGPKSIILLLTLNHVSGDSIELDFHAFSRIDGLPIYDIDTNNLNNIKYPLKEYYTTINNKKYTIEDCHLIKPIEDNIKHYTYQSTNETKIIDFILEGLNIDKKDLDKKDAYKNIIREIKLNKII
jgi:hypothetical protein